MNFFKTEGHQKNRNKKQIEMATTERDLHKLQTRDVAPSNDLILKVVLNFRVWS